MTVSLVRLIVHGVVASSGDRVLREVARKVSEKLRRTEEARIYHWYERTENIPAAAIITAKHAMQLQSKRINSHSRTTDTGIWM